MTKSSKEQPRVLLLGNTATIQELDDDNLISKEILTGHYTVAIRCGQCKNGLDALDIAQKALEDHKNELRKKLRNL